MVLVVVVFGGLTEVLKPRRDFEDPCDSVTFFPIKVSKALGQVLVGGYQLSISEALMNASQGF